MASTGDALDPTGTDTTKTTLSTDPGQPMTRRERREREAAAAASATGSAVVPVAASTAAVARVAAAQADAREVAAVPAPRAIPAPEAPVASVVRNEDGVVPAAFGPRIRAPRVRLPRKRTVAAGAVMALATGLFATAALPAYAYGGGGSFDAQATSTSFGEEQTLQIPNANAILTVSRDGYTAPTPEELAAAQQAAEAAAQAVLEQEAAAAAAASASTSSSSGSTSASSYEFAPPTSSYSGAAVIAYAQQFVGVVPYSAGNTPATGFGCDGLTQYVMGQFGISLPRGVSAQAALMQRIDPSDAQPGDFLIYPGQHIGFYAGGGMMIDSPDWGRYVEYRPIWGSPYYARYVG